MTITSNLFFIFTALGLCIYYIVPKRMQWIILLILSYIYYSIVDISALCFIIFSTFITYISALCISHIRTIENNDDGNIKNSIIVDKTKIEKKAKRIVIFGIIMDLSVLIILKYTNFAIENINLITKANIKHINLLLPLGISYYTFQTIGYLLDVYWKRAKEEKNFFKYALFVSFFPQLIQGPIGRFERLSKQLIDEHELDIKNIKFGLERIIWGLFKKMIISEWASIYRIAIFADQKKYAGIAIFGVLLYTIELYGDFAGGIDIVLGIARMFGIKLDENFRQPLFATSISDFWRRWHISLGSWMKDYVFYPLTLSKGMMKLQKYSKSKIGRKRGRFVTIAISDLIVFILVGLWHGPSWNNIGWGAYNGIIIAISGFIPDIYEKWKKLLHINDKSKGYHIFMILRTFALFNIGQYFDLTSSFKEAFSIIRYSVSYFRPSEFLMISSGKLGTEYTPYALLTLCIACIIWFVISVLKERGMDMEMTLTKMPFILEFGIFLVLFICIPLFSPMSVARGFIYAQF